MKGGMSMVDSDVVVPIAVTVASRKGTLWPELPSATVLLDVQLPD